MIEFKRYFFVVTSNKIVRILGKFISLGNKAMAITFYPFIFIRQDKRNNEELLRHEVIHIRQQIELLIIGAWLLFVIEYLYARFIKNLDSRQSYYFTSAEQEAHRNAIRVDYLKTRKSYAILKYVYDKKKLSRGPNDELIVEEY